MTNLEGFQIQTALSPATGREVVVLRPPFGGKPIGFAHLTQEALDSLLAIGWEVTHG